MSTDIVFQRHVTSCQGNGEVLYMLYELYGCNNCRTDAGEIAKNWNVVAFGRYRDVLARVVAQAGSCAGGTLQHGSGNSYYPVTSQGFVAAWMKKMATAVAHPLGVATVRGQRNRSYEKEEVVLANFNAAKTIALDSGGVVDEQEVRWDLTVPAQASAYAAFRRVATNVWPSDDEVSRYPRLDAAGHHIADPAMHLSKAVTVDVVSKKLVKVFTSEHGDRFLERENPHDLLHDFCVSREIAQVAADAARRGEDPLAIIRCSERALAQLPLTPATVSFTVRQSDVDAPPQWQESYLGGVRKASEVVTVPVASAVRYAIHWAAETTTVSFSA